MGKILIVEDDETTATWLIKAIRQDLADLQPEVEILETESEFVLTWLPLFKRGAKKRPDAIIIDGMLSWTDPAPNQPARPPEVIEGGFARAGLRLYQLIQSDPVLSSCKVILFTNLSQEDVASLGGKPQELTYVPKVDGHAVLKPLRTALSGPTAGNVSSARND